ncbi:hypothetical protein [Phenylobacterium montanum]|uniref:Uncharacterized protein n=1 Tax=Phenylobacterium montanum TaxID=2823693 RepID=A0A975FYK4_9CAUL|nr:hypothetical protein [Caulobacter sp. S6]QUD87800.1 hypothetical protein KCG34_22595 [Caulobacter sp. S6]
MPRYKTYTPKNISELMDLLGLMMLSSPTFVDKTGYFPERNIDTVFEALTESLKLMQKKLGEDRYARLIEMSNRMRAHFEADPEDKTDDSLKGRELIEEMETLLKQSARKS